MKPWNDLASHVVNAETIDTFKRRLDEAWKDDTVKFNHKPNILTESDQRPYLAYESVNLIIIIYYYLLTELSQVFDTYILTPDC